MPKASQSRWPSAYFLTSSTRRRGVGLSVRFPNSSITTSSTKADTSRRGNSRSSFRKSFARASDHCANSGGAISPMPLLEESHQPFHDPKHPSLGSIRFWGLVALCPYPTQTIEVWAAELEALLIRYRGCTSECRLLKFLHPLPGISPKRFERKGLAVLSEGAKTGRFLGPFRVGIRYHQGPVTWLEEGDDRIMVENKAVTVAMDWPPGRECQ